MEKFDIKLGSCFIDTTKNFDEVKLAFVVKDTENDPNQTVVSWYNFPYDPTKIKIEEYKGVPFPDLNSPFTELSSEYEEIRDKTNKVRQDFINELYKAPQKKLEINAAIKTLSESAQISLEESEAVIKLFIAKGELKYASQKGGKFLILSSVFTDIEDKKRFLSSITEELTSKSERIGLIIKHHQTTGNYREQLLVSVLKKYLPTKYHVSTGFIDGRQKQIDILIYDQLNYLPLFRENDLVVVKPESVRAVIEVKTTLDSESLWDGLEGINKIFKHSTHIIPVFKGIFAFNSKYDSNKSIVKRVIDFYNDSSSSYYSTQLNDLVDSICVPDKHIVFTDYVKPGDKYFNGTISPACYSFENQRDISVESASFFSDLFAHLDVDKSAKKINLSHFEILGHEINYSFEGFIHENWVPQSSFRNEHNFSQEGISERLEDLKQWFRGKKVADELYEKYFGDLEE